MVATYLTDEMIKSGANLVERMDAAGLEPEAAFWLYDAESENWKLLIADAKIGQSGPRDMYRQIQKLLSQVSGLSLDEVSLTTPSSSVVTLLRGALRTGPGISGIRFKNNVVNGTVIEDAYIYRLR